MTNTLKVSAFGAHVDDRDSQAIEYGATFEPDAWLGATVVLYNGYSRENSNFPAEDLDAVIAALTELRTKMRVES